MNFKQSCLAGVAVAALVTGAAGCTSDGSDPVGKAPAKADRAAASGACGTGKYVWFNVSEREVLTGLAKAQTLGKKGGKLTEKLRRLHTPETRVQAEGPVPKPEQVLFALARHLGDAEGDEASDDLSFTDTRRPIPDINADSAGVDGPGEFVEYAYIRTVTADFHYTCPDGTSTVGSAVGWTLDGGGGLECATPIDDETHTVGRDAARMSCGPGAPAARGR